MIDLSLLPREIVKRLGKILADNLKWSSTGYTCFVCKTNVGDESHLDWCPMGQLSHVAKDVEQFEAGLLAALQDQQAQIDFATMRALNAESAVAFEQKKQAQAEASLLALTKENADLRRPLQKARD